MHLLVKKIIKLPLHLFRYPGKIRLVKRSGKIIQHHEPHHGISFSGISDAAGPHNRFTAQGPYAYHLGLSPTTNSSTGFSASITSVSLSGNKDNLPDPNDPAFGNINSELRKIRSDIDMVVQG
jgi:Type IX secretion system membrane protein PorP/SprF